MSFMNPLSLGSLLSLCTSGVALASMPAPIPLVELYGIAKFVGVVEVLQGQVVDAGGDTCGARYRGKVIEEMKNATVGQVVEFGYVPNLKIGTKYLLLLSDYNSVPVEAIPEFQERCRDVLPSQAVAGIWRGAMEIAEGVGVSDPRKSWTVRPNKYVIYPLGTRTTTVDGDKQLVFTDLMKRVAGKQ